jgi:hypothetical protein
MEQLSLFDFPDEPIIFKAPVAIPQGKWDAWWLELLRHPRDEWEDADDDAEPRHHGLAKQDRIPGLDLTGPDHLGM